MTWCVIFWILSFIFTIATISIFADKKYHSDLTLATLFDLEASFIVTAIAIVIELKRGEEVDLIFTLKHFGIILGSLSFIEFLWIFL